MFSDYKHVVVILWGLVKLLVGVMIFLITKPMIFWFSYLGFTLTLPEEEREGFGFVLVFPHLLLLMFVLFLAPHEPITMEWHVSYAKLYLLCYVVLSAMIYFVYYGRKWSKEVEQKNEGKPKRYDESYDDESSYELEYLEDQDEKSLILSDGELSDSALEMLS